MYYIKKATVQDVTRTFVLNKEAIDDFFHLNLRERDAEAFVGIRYRPEGDLHMVRIVLKQDPRIFFDRYNLDPGNLVMFQQTSNKEYTLSIIKRDDVRFDHLSSYLNRYNYALMNSLD